jgi:hypothetical protein
MPELAEQIREVIDRSAPPVTIDEIRRFRRAMAVAPERVAIIQASKRQQPRRWRFILTAAAVIVLIIAGLVVAPLGSHAPTQSAAAAALGQLAETAAGAPPQVVGPGQYEYSEYQSTTIENTNRGWYFYTTQDIQTWADSEGAGKRVTTPVGPPVPATPAARAAWIADGSPPIPQNDPPSEQTYPIAAQGTSGGESKLPFYDVQDLPTDPTQIGAFLAQVTQPATLIGDSAFGRAIDYLQAGASPAQRAALYQFIASLPGIKALGQTTVTGSGQSGVGFADDSSADDISTGTQIQAIIDPATSLVLEVRYVVTDPNIIPASLVDIAGSLPAGTTLASIVFTKSGAANSLGEVPTGQR